MKPHRISILILVTLAISIAAEEKVNLADPKQKISYSIGSDIAASLKRQGLELEPKAFAAGFVDTFTEKPLLTEAQIQETILEFRKEFMAKHQAKQKLATEKNLKEGEGFLAANAKKEGVTITESGLQYKILHSGTGRSPSKTDKVKVHYHGTLVDGTIFDSSVDRGEPVTFEVNRVIPGWTEALQLMKEGDKWQLYIPSKLAYGEQAPGGKIGPNATLIFDVELISIE